MAIVTDPDVLSRSDVIYGTASQLISIYPVGDTERNGAGVEYIDVFASTTGEITTGLGSFAAAAPGDVIAIQNNVDAGHYYVRTETTPLITLAAVDTGTGGVEITSLTINQKTFAFGDVVSEQITGLTAHGYVTGDAIVYNEGASGNITNLATATPFYVIRIDANTIELATTFALAVAGTRIAIVGVAGAAHTLDDRLIVTIFNNGANTVEQISGNDTSGDGDGDVADGITLQATYSFGKEEWRVDSQITDVDSNHYNDDLIRHEFAYEAITSEQFETGGGTSHDAWNWFNLYTRKKIRTAGWAEKNNVSVNDLARQTGIITLGNLDSDAQVYFQQVSVVTPSVDFTFLGPVNEALQVQRDDDQDLDFTDGSDFDRTTFLKLFVRKKGRSYTGSQISDIGVTTIQTIVNRFPLAHVVDTSITITDANLLGATPYKFGTAPVAIENNTDGDKTSGGNTFTSVAVGDFAAAGVVAGDILEIANADADDGFYEITTVATTTITVTEFETVAGNDFTFGTGWAVTDASTIFNIFTYILTPAPGVVTLRDTGVLVDGTATNLVDIDGATGTLTDGGGVNFTTDGVAADDILIISQFYDISFNASTDVDVVTADTITNATHNLRTGDRVRYDINGGTVIAGLVDDQIYYVAVETSGRFWMTANLADAWARHHGASTEIALTPGVSEAHLLHVHEGDGYYKINTVAATILTVDTGDYQFPTTAKTIGTFYRVVEAGMWLQFKDKTVQLMTDTQTTAPLTDLDFSVGASLIDTITIAGGGTNGFDYLDDTQSVVSVQAGDILVITGSTSNDGRYTVLTRTSALVLIVEPAKVFVAADINDQAGVTLEIRQGFERTLGTNDVAFNWKISGNGGTLNQVFEVIQSELRQSIDIDQGAGTFTPSGSLALVGFIGDINDLLMSFAAPTGTGLNLIIDDIAANDINNATFNDHGGTARNFPFTSAGSLVFNPNLTNDTNSKYWLFFTNDDAGTNLGRDYGTQDAIIVDDATSPTPNPITGFVNAPGDTHQGGGTGRSVSAGTTSITFTFAYDTNLQRGTGSDGADAPVTLIAIGAPVGQFVIAAGTIVRTTGITISAVAALERNYNGSLTA